MKMDGESILNIVLALLLPPVAVFLKKGVGRQLLVSIVLTMLFFVPGSIYALLIVLGRIA
jgi:uncharacterized membrane protein YqaE (UPF0057 family)